MSENVICTFTHMNTPQELFMSIESQLYMDILIQSLYSPSFMLHRLQVMIKNGLSPQ